MRLGYEPASDDEWALASGGASASAWLSLQQAEMRREPRRARRWLDIELSIDQ